MRVKNGQVAKQPGLGCGDCCIVWLGRHHREKQVEQAGCQCGAFPSHPLLYECTLLQVGREQHGIRPAFGEVAQDGAGLPKDEAIIIDRGGYAVGVELAIRRIQRTAVLHAGNQFELIFFANLFQCNEYLL